MQWRAAAVHRRSGAQRANGLLQDLIGGMQEQGGDDAANGGPPPIESAEGACPGTW